MSVPRSFVTSGAKGRPRPSGPKRAADRSCATVVPPAPHHESRYEAIGIAAVPACVHRGYAIVVVLDRLSTDELWSGRALISFQRTLSRPVAVLQFDGLPTTEFGDHACRMVLEAARTRIDHVEDADYGVWPAGESPTVR